MNDTTTEAPNVTLLEILKLYEQRFSQEGVAMRLRCKTSTVTRMLGRYGLKQADILRRMRAGETAEQINDTAAPVNSKPIPGAVGKAALAFIPVFEKVTSGSALPQELSDAFAALKGAAAAFTAPATPPENAPTPTAPFQPANPGVNGPQNSGESYPTPPAAAQG